MKKTPFKAKQACINDAQGNVITEKEPVLERWREYNEQLFAKPLNEPTLATQDYNVPEPVPLYREVSSAILHLKRMKAPGVDGIPADLIRASGLNAVEAIYRLSVKIWRDCSWQASNERGRYNIIRRRFWRKIHLKFTLRRRHSTVR